MSLLIVSVLLALLATAWVVSPILTRRLALLGDVVPGSVLDAQARRRVALASLKELEYDYVAGKLDETDYQALREKLSLEALQAIRAADAKPAARAVVDAGEVEVEAHGCGFSNRVGSRFCAGCGARLA